MDTEPAPENLEVQVQSVQVNMNPQLYQVNSLQRERGESERREAGRTAHYQEVMFTLSFPSVTAIQTVLYPH